MFTIRNHAIDMFVLLSYVDPSPANLPLYLRNMSLHKECLFTYTGLTISGDWTEYYV